MVGRLRNFLPKWKEITQDKRILSWILGLKIPFVIKPTQSLQPSEIHWSDSEKITLRASVQELLAMGAISKVSHCKGEFISSIFLRPKPDGSRRLILNLKSLNKIIRISTPPTVATAYPGCRALIQQGLELRGTPKTATEVCLASITASTIKQYNSGLKLWYQFCHTKNESCFSASATVVLEFLQEQYDRGASYGTLNSYRSAIAQLLGPSMSEDILIRRFFKGVFHLRPNLPKYKNTWDPLIVLNYLKTLDNENISLEQISYKLAMLLALVSAQRVQTLSLIELKDIKSSSQGVQIFVSSRIKTSGPNREQPIIALPFYEADRAICVATTLLYYIKLTRSIRSPESNRLLITFKKPHHNASSQTISRWIRNVLSKAGIDPNKYTSHSTRHASTSLADRKGISVDVIRAAAGWSQQSKTFAIFYKRPVCDTYAYARALLE
nr:unnamed protein product [Callosobruchus chinensis]